MGECELRFEKHADKKGCFSRFFQNIMLGLRSEGAEGRGEAVVVEVF